MTNKTATLQYKDQTFELPIHSGTCGPDVIEISSLAANGVFTLDPGFVSTASCLSKITYIDGGKGILLYRGYPIKELAEQSSFLEVCYLLFYGELPTKAEKKAFEHDVKYHTMIHEQIIHFFRGFRRDAHPMAVMVGAVGALSAFYHGVMNISDQKDRDLTACRLIAKIPTIAAMCYKNSLGQPFMPPRNELSYSENFLQMMFATPCEPYVPNPVFAEAMDRILILHADHEQNASTSTVRMAGSTGANPYACIASGISALWGPAHGGANEAALNMLRTIGDPENIPKFIAKAKDKNDPFRLMGFGHRVYKSYDPRAQVMQETCKAVLAELGEHDSPVLAIAQELEAIALKDEYFIEKKLYPNVDFYSGIVLNAIGIPSSMFTVIFAMARSIGWISQWNEMIADPQMRLNRPRQLYIGQGERPYKAMTDR